MPSVEQESNLEFLLESGTIMGGLMVLLSSERQNRKARAQYTAHRPPHTRTHGVAPHGRRASTPVP